MAYFIVRIVVNALAVALTVVILPGIQLALKPFWADVPGVPGGRCFSHLGAGLCGIVDSHFCYSLLNTKRPDLR
jgi:hypothetical protein